MKSEYSRILTIKCETLVLFKQLFVQNRREWQVYDDRVVDGQATQLADQMVHVASFECLVVEPNCVGFFVEDEHTCNNKLYSVIQS